MPIVGECPVSLGAMGVRAQVVECLSAVLAQAAATLLPSALSYHPFCNPTSRGKNTKYTSAQVCKNKGEGLNHDRYSVRTLIASLEHS